MLKACLECIRSKRDNDIRDLLDGVAPSDVFPVFEEILQMLDEPGQLTDERSVADRLLVVMDGTEYFSSTKIHCPQCSTRTNRSGDIQYGHTVKFPK